MATAKPRSKKTASKTRPGKPAPASRRAKARNAARPRRAGRSWLRGLGRLAVLGVIWGGVALGGLLAYEATKLPDVSDIESMTRRGGVRLLASDGVEFASYGALHGRPIRAEQLPRPLIDALLATEDRRFHDHFGVDPISILRAVVVNIRDGAVRQGGSTLTQQLAKNLFLTPDRSLERKLQELLLAFWLEASFSKQQILTIYLNRVYFGSGAYGVTAAARRYFGKPVEQLGLYESALLAGLLKAPSRYNPVANPDLSAKRTRQVLLNMVDADLLDRNRADAASARPAPTHGPAGTSRGHRYFADWAQDRAAAYAGPMRQDRIVRTTLDRRLQRQAEAAVRSGLEAGAARDAAQAAMVVLAPDGAVLAMVGGRDHAASQFNRATQALRQPGSAFKPLVYLSALSAGYRPDNIIDDAPVNIDGWSPGNFDGVYRGPVTLREALASSLNAATVRLSETIGRRGTIRLARRLGITARLNDEPSLALGTGEVTLLQLTAAYAALANGGHPVEPHGVRNVAGADGTVVYRHQPVLPPAIAGSEVLAELDDMLRSVIRTGTGKRAAIGRSAAGKTGTSQDYRDAWFIGYAGELVAGVWVGRDDARPMKGVTGGGLPAKIWARFMREATRRRLAGSGS